MDVLRDFNDYVDMDSDLVWALFAPTGYMYISGLNIPTTFWPTSWVVYRDQCHFTKLVYNKGEEPQ